MSDEAPTLDINDLPPDEPDKPQVEEEIKPVVKRWVPKKWKPSYQEVVMYHVMGYTNKEIAAATGFSHFHVGVILNCPQAEGVIDKCAEHLQAIKLGKQKARIERMADRALDRIEATLNDDDLAEAMPLPLMDRAIKFAIAARTLQPAEGATVTETTNNMNVGGNVTAFAVPREMLEALIAGTQKSDEVRRLNAG